jgi:hypothetical protein
LRDGFRDDRRDVFRDRGRGRFELRFWASRRLGDLPDPVLAPAPDHGPRGGRVPDRARARSLRAGSSPLLARPAGRSAPREVGRRLRGCAPRHRGRRRGLRQPDVGGKRRRLGRPQESRQQAQRQQADDEDRRYPRDPAPPDPHTRHPPLRDGEGEVLPPRPKNLPRNPRARLAAPDTLRGASSSVGQMALPFGLPASYPRSVRHSPSAHAGFEAGSTPARRAPSRCRRAGRRPSRPDCGRR